MARVCRGGRKPVSDFGPASRQEDPFGSGADPSSTEQITASQAGRNRVPYLEPFPEIHRRTVHEWDWCVPPSHCQLVRRAKLLNLRKLSFPKTLYAMASVMQQRNGRGECDGDS